MVQGKTTSRGIIFFFLIFAILTAVDAIAQPLTATVVMPPHPSPYLADWIAGREEVLLIVQNPGTTTVQALLKVQLYLDEQLQAETDIDKLEPVAIPPGSSTFYAQDFLRLEAITFYGDSRTSVERSGRLPSGNYRFCFQLLDPDTHAPLTSLPEVCRSFQVLLYTPPQLLQPNNGDTVRSLSELLFQWTPLIPAAPSPITYRLQVFEVLEGQQPIEAYQSNPPIIDIAFPDRTTVPYQPEMGLLQPGRTYIWTVQVTDAEGRPLFLPDGRAEPFVFTYQPEERTMGGEGKRKGSEAGESGTITHLTTLRIGRFTIILSDTLHCSSDGCTLTGTGKIFIPLLNDSLSVHFTNLQVTVTDTPGVARVIAGVVAVTGTWILELFPGHPEFRLEITQWQFLPAVARISGQLFFDGTSWDLPCVVSQTLPIDNLPVLPDSIGFQLPTGWTCSGITLSLGDCFTLHFDSITVAIHLDGSALTATAFLSGTATISCWTVGGEPVSFDFRSQIQPGQVDLLLIAHFALRNAKVAGMPLWISADSLILDASSLENHPRFSPPSGCSSPGWSSPLWKGIWIPTAQVKVLVEQDSLIWDLQNIILEDLGDGLAISFRGDATFSPPHPIQFAGFTVRLDSAAIRLCQNSIEMFRANGLLQLPPSLQKPTEWAALDSMYVRLAGQQSGDQFVWLGTLDLFGGIDLLLPPSAPIAALHLRNGQIAKVSATRGYVEFTTIQFQAPPDNPAAVVQVSGLRIWNDGHVEVSDADGWLDVSSWARLHIGGLTIQASEIGIGYEGGHWWAGLSGGFEIAAASGLSGGANGLQLRRLRIFDDGRMLSEGTNVQFTIGGAIRINGTLSWGDIHYGSILTHGMAGQLTGRFDCLGGLQTAIDFAFGSTQGASPFRFWYLSGEAAIPGGVPIVPGAFHLVGGVLGAGWHVRMDGYNKNLITTAGFAAPPPIIPDESISLLLRGGLLFADPSLQAYLFRLTSSLALGNSFQIGLDGDLNLLPSIDLAHGTLSAQYLYNNSASVISLSGGVAVNLLNLHSISAGFSSTFTPSNPCLQIGPLQRRWLFVDMNENFGSDLLGVDVVARGYADLTTMYLRLCPSEGQFVGSIYGAGVAGALLHVAGVGHVPFHVGLSFGSQLCLRYALKLENRPSSFWARAKAGLFLNTSANFDYSGWWSWGWKGTQAWDHIRTNPPVALNQHWNACNGDKCRQQSLSLTLSGIFEGELSVPKIQATVAGRTIEFPNWFGTTPAIRYGYYAYASAGDREWAKSGGNHSVLVSQAQDWSCSTFSHEADTWADENRQQQQPPAFIRYTEPPTHTTDVDPADPQLHIVFGAPIGESCTAGSGTRCWYVQQSSLQFWLEEMEDDRSSIRKVWHLAPTYRNDTAWLAAQIPIGGSSWVNAALRPNSWYRLIISGNLRSPDPAAVVAHRDTIWFRTAPQIATAELRVFLHTAGIWQQNAVGQFLGVLSTRHPISQIDIVDASSPSGLAFYALQPGRDWWLEIHNRNTGDRFWWRGTAHPPLIDTATVRMLGIPVGTAFRLDSAYFQPFVTRSLAFREDHLQLLLQPGVYEFRMWKASGGTRPAEAQAFLDALPNPIASWRVVKLPYRSLDTTLWVSLQWNTPPNLSRHRAFVKIHNAGSTPIYPGTPLRLRIQKRLVSADRKDTSTVETTMQVALPTAIFSGEAFVLPITITPDFASAEDKSSYPRVIGIRVELLADHFTLNGNVCISAGMIDPPCPSAESEGSDEMK